MQAFDLLLHTDPSYAEVLDSMYFTSTLEMKHQAGAAPTLDVDCLSFSLAFKGAVSGRFGLILGPSAARILAANFLGEEEESLTPAEIADVTGELVNMLCGSLVSRVPSPCDFVLSHPEPCALLSIPLSPGNLLSTLQTDNGPLQVWIALEETA